MQVWNPCFDVTPGSWIECIITEEGVVPRDAGTGLHKVADFMAARQQQQTGAAEGKDWCQQDSSWRLCDLPRAQTCMSL